MPDPKTIARRLDAFRRALPLLVGNETVNFALDNWDKQGFQGASFKKWPGRKHDNSNRAVLVGKQSGRLRRSVRITRQSPQSVEAGSELEYAGIHNEGGEIAVTVTPKSRRFFWAMYYKTGADMWKGMALTKKKVLRFRMPERRFIGESPELDARVKRIVEAQLRKVFM